MRVTLEIPDELAKYLGEGDLSREALEALGLEAYRSKRITKAQLRRLLGVETRYELDGFLKGHEVWDDITIEDVRRDVEDIRKALGR